MKKPIDLNLISGFLFIGVGIVFILILPKTLGVYCLITLSFFVFANYKTAITQKIILNTIGRTLLYLFLSIFVLRALYVSANALTNDESLDPYVDNIFLLFLVLHLTLIPISIILKYTKTKKNRSLKTNQKQT